MSEFTDIYKEYIILQYYSKSKATAEMELYASEFENVFDFLNDFVNQFDIDKATGDRLDLIGKIVGVSRIVEGGVVKYYFGFSGAVGALAYGEGRYRGANDDTTANSTLDDGTYRVFIKAKVAKNNVAAVSVSDERTGIQETVSQLFGNKGYIVDNLDMTMTLNLDNSVPSTDVDLIVNAGLLPNPQGVGFIINYIAFV